MLGPSERKIKEFLLEEVPPSAFNWIASAEDWPFQKARLFQLGNNIYFCEVGCGQSYSSIGSELSAVTSAIDSWAACVQQIQHRLLSCELLYLWSAHSPVAFQFPFLHLIRAKTSSVEVNHSNVEWVDEWNKKTWPPQVEPLILIHKVENKLLGTFEWQAA